MKVAIGDSQIPNNWTASQGIAMQWLWEDVERLKNDESLS
jgi:hypothetical protein